MHLEKGGANIRPFCKQKNARFSSTYENAQDQLTDVLEASVKRRLISDVPLGSFLSGGIDSSAIVALASRHASNLSTFSIGYKEHSFFDETHYAELVAKRFNTNHTVFSLTNDDLLADIVDIVNYIDEPFADSSAIPTYILSKKVASKVTVALSGDGADELFGGYYKHQALSAALHPSLAGRLVKKLNPVFRSLPQSRSGKLGNMIRRLDKYGKMLQFSDHERYWFLASLTNDPSRYLRVLPEKKQTEDFKQQFLKENPEFNDYLDADLSMLLPGDMLTKVDLMSMANSLEVRVPFLDKEMVAFARSLPASFKVAGNQRKRVLQDAFREILPPELYHRPKKGFELPLLQWMRKELLGELDSVLFNHDVLQEQSVFQPDEVLNLRKKLLSSNPGDVHGIIWALYIFQKWYGNYFQK